MSAPTFSFDDENVIRALSAGFFDGDGCASGCHDRPRIDFNQTVKDRAIIDFFHSSFGGGISDVKQRKNRATSIRWNANGEDAVKFSKFVIPYVLKSRKRRELGLIVSREKGFGDVIKAGREDADDAISLEDVGSSMTTEEIDAYAAGFFLADGSACVQSGTKAGAKVTFSQKDPTILYFFKEHFGVGNVVNENEKHPERTRNFEIYGEDAKTVAARIAPYLPIGSGKRKILEALQVMSRGNDAGVRELMDAYNGNKPSSESRKLNAKGCISAHKKNGTIVGYYARFLQQRRSFCSTKNAPERNKKLAEECLADMIRSNKNSSVQDVGM
jgi:hypothetical protein